MRNLSSEAAAPAGVARFVYRDQNGEAESAARRPGLCEEEIRQREQRARREGRAEAEQSLKAALDQGLQQERLAVAACLREFEQQRERYFLRLEQEVVQLVLGITRKVLNREAQLDPLLLAAGAHLALDQLAAGTAVRMFVPPSQLAQWADLLRREPPLAVEPELRPDGTLEPDGCRLETSTGTTDLSLEAQVQEVERSFSELLQRRTALVRQPARAKTTAAGA